MDPLAAFRHAVGESLGTTRTSFSVLASGALALVVVAVLASPAVQGLVGLPGHAIEKQPAPVVAASVRPHAARTSTVRPDLTPRQRAVARSKSVTFAAREVGTAEWGGSTNTGRRIIQYRRAVTTVGENPRSREPWCADFVSWAWRSAGIPIGFGGRGSDYVPELVLWGRLTGRWHTSGGDYSPVKGDLIVYRVGEDRKGHVGLVVRRDGSRVSTIEGNYKDRVSRRSVLLSNPNVTGFISPV